VTLHELWPRGRAVLGVGLAAWAMFSSDPPAGLHGRHLVMLVLLVVASLGWLAGTFLDRSPRLLAAGLVLCGAAGLAIYGLGPNGAGLIYAVSANILAATKLPRPWHLVYAGALAVAYTAVDLQVHDNWIWLLGGNAGVAFTFMGGVLRRQAKERAEQHELLLIEQAHSAALAERSRIAREIHDVLAHTLTALSVQLETIDALLDRDRTAQARETVARARTLMREGLAETRRAISALRDDTLPLPELLRILADAYVADTAAPSTVEITGPQRSLGAEAGLTLYRTAQEAVTNARKHAPGATISMILAYEPSAVSLRVDSLGGGEPAPTSFDRVGGYGLTGLRERAELAGGRFSADPIDGGWRVNVMIPT
jgi:signal transduction histidine kinase